MLQAILLETLFKNLSLFAWWKHCHYHWKSEPVSTKTVIASSKLCVCKIWSQHGAVKLSIYQRQTWILDLNLSTHSDDEVLTMQIILRLMIAPSRWIIIWISHLQVGRVIWPSGYFYLFELGSSSMLLRAQFFGCNRITHHHDLLCSDSKVHSRPLEQLDKKDFILGRFKAKDCSPAALGTCTIGIWACTLFDDMLCPAVILGLLLWVRFGICSALCL